jgi:SAM-dependent methyltransferase
MVVMTMRPPPRESAPVIATIQDLARCLDCGARIQGEPGCPGCGRSYPVRDGILEAIGPLTGRNRIAAAFYDGPGWRRFQPWERGFLILQGGARKARMQMLRHVLAGVSERPCATALEVGIGDGANLAFVPPGWTVYGVDVSRRQLAATLDNHRAMAGRLAWAEAENLPFEDATVDACWSIGGFTYYRDHEAALREMRRVTRPGGPVVVADEIPGLHRAGLGHLLGVPSFDAWWLRLLGLDREFVDMVLNFDVDLRALCGRVWPGAVQHRIWHELGYCLVDTSIG